MTVQQVQQVESLLDWRQRLKALRESWVTQKFPAIGEGLMAELEKTVKELEALNDELAKEITGE